jgi:hypothetical protein
MEWGELVFYIIDVIVNKPMKEVILKKIFPLLGFAILYVI